MTKERDYLKGILLSLIFSTTQPTVFNNLTSEKQQLCFFGPGNGVLAIALIPPKSTVNMDLNKNPSISTTTSVRRVITKLSEKSTIQDLDVANKDVITIKNTKFEKLSIRSSLVGPVASGIESITGLKEVSTMACIRKVFKSP